MSRNVLLVSILLLMLAVHCTGESATEFPEDAEDDADDEAAEPEKKKQLDIFVVDFSHVSTPFIISLWIAIAGLAKIGKVFIYKRVFRGMYWEKGVVFFIEMEEGW